MCQANAKRNFSVTSMTRVHDERGSALIITLLLITILVGLVVNFVYDVYIDSSALSNWSNAQRASYIAKSGQNIASTFIKQIDLYPPTNIREIALPVARDFGPGSTLVITVEDENSKLNINAIANPDNIPVLQKLFEYLKINPEIALAVADWVDSDSEPRLPDSEDVAKNGELWSVDELKLIKGINAEIFEKLIPYVTVTPNWLDWKVNINTAELPVLISIESEMNESLAERIIEFRKDSPFENVGQLQNISGFETLGINFVGKSDVRSRHYRVRTRATVNDIPRIIESIIDTKSKVYFWREV